MQSFLPASLFPVARPAGARELSGCSEDPTAAAIDSHSVKTTESGGPAGYDASKNIRGCRRRIAVDVEGTPIMIEVHTADI